MKFLVIGGAGYIGSHFIREALEQGHSCIAYDNLSLGHKKAIPDSCPLVEANLLDKESLKRAIDEHCPDAVFHFAAYALVGESVTHPAKYYENNVEGVRGLLDVLKEDGKSIPLIFSSTCAVFGVPQSLPIKEGDPKNPISPYGRSKLMSEFLIEDYSKAYGLRGVALRYFNACGAHDSASIGEDHQPETHLIPNVIKSALGGKSLRIFGRDFDTADGTCVRDYIHVKDLAIAHIKAAGMLVDSDKGFYDVYQLGTGKGFSNLEIVKAVEEVIGKKIDFSFADRRPGDPPALYTSVEKASRDLKFSAEFSDLENIIRTAYLWHKNNPEGY